MKTNTKLVLSVLLIGASAWGVGACGGDDEPQAAAAPKNVWQAGTSNATEQVEGGCNTNGIVIKGNEGAGAACERASDCNAVCCTCPSGKKAWAGASCVSGQCADEATVCATTKDDGAFCSE
ncbi:MAG: hypothetical protein JWP87_3658 [Labilithrix sp.]|nr:hypothetical protein [Labilithrix sp.]